MHAILFCSHSYTVHECFVLPHDSLVQDSLLLLDCSGARLQPVLDTQVAVATLQLGGLEPHKGMASLKTAGGGWPSKLGLGNMLAVGQGLS